MEVFVCHHNRGVQCECPECDSCGWNPEVARARLSKITKGGNPMTKLYKIPFTGYCEVWAKNPEEAADMAEDIEKQFFAHYDYGEPECLKKEDVNE